MLEEEGETEIDGCFGQKRKSRNVSGDHLVQQSSEDQRPINEKDLREIFDEVDNNGLLDPNFLNKQALDTGNTLLHLAASDSKIRELATLLKHGADPYIKNEEGKSAVCLIVEMENGPEILQSVMKMEPKLRTHNELGFELLRQSLSCCNFVLALKIIELFPDCLGHIVNDGSHSKSIIHVAYEVMQQLGYFWQDHFEDSDELENCQKNITSIMDCCLQGMPQRSLINEHYKNSILDILIFTNNVEAMKTIFERFQCKKSFLSDFCNQTNKEGRTAIGEVIRTANDPKKGAEMIELISSQGGKIDKAVADIVRSPDMNVFQKLFLLKDSMDIDPANYQESDEGCALHYALETSNGYLDVPAFLEMLFKNGANVMATWRRRPFVEGKQDRQTECILPLHIAVEMQYGPDNGIGKRRCDDYFQALNNFGLEKLYNALEEDENVRKSFLIEHLTIAVYRSDFQTVHDLLQLVCVGNHCTGTRDQFCSSVLRSERTLNFTDRLEICNKTILHWMAEGVNKQIMMEIVKILHMFHKKIGEESKGLRCVQKLHRNSNLKIKAAEAYKELMGPTSSKCAALLGVFFEVFISKYCLMFADLYFDFYLIANYLEMSKYTSSNGSFPFSNLDTSSNNTFAYSNSDFNDLETNFSHRLGLVWPISILVIICSCIGYFIVSWVSAPLPSMVGESGWRYYFCSFFKPIIFLISHPISAYQSKSNRTNAEYRTKYKEGWRAWVTVGRIELCIESNPQLLIQLYIMPSLSDVFTNWYESETIIYHLWRGLGYLFSFTYLDADFEEIMVAKYLMSSIFLCHHFTIFRVQKKSQRWADSKEAYFAYFFSAFFQLVLRTISLYNLFKLPSMSIMYFLICHFVIVFILKYSFEVNSPCESGWIFFKTLFQVLVATLGSVFVYINIDNSNLAVKCPDVKRSMFPVMAHFALTLIEHIVIISLTKPNEAQIIAPFILWILALFMITLFYYSFHKAQVFGRLGPQFGRGDENEEDRQGLTSCLAACFADCRKDPDYRHFCSGACNDGCCQRILDDQGEYPRDESPYYGHVYYRGIICCKVREMKTSLRWRSLFKQLPLPFINPRNPAIEVRDGHESFNNEINGQNSIELQNRSGANIKCNAKSIKLEDTPIQVRSEISTKQEDNIVSSTKATLEIQTYQEYINDPSSPKATPKSNGNGSTHREILNCQYNGHSYANGHDVETIEVYEDLRQDNDLEDSPKLPKISILTNGQNHEEHEN